MRIMRSYTVLLSFVCLGGVACQNDTELNETTVLGAQSIHKGTVYASPVADVNLATIYERNFPGCTGVLLKGATPAVLTNAHCVAAYSDYGVSFGQKNGADFVMVPTKQVYPVSGDSAMHHSKRRLHSGFIDPKRAHLKSDIAVLFLEGAPGNMPGVTLDCTKTGPTLPKAVEVHAGTSLLSGSLASENVGFKNWGAFNIASDDSDVWNKGAFTILPNGYQHLINGDSGSPVYDPSTSKMVGLVYGGLEVHNGRTYNVGYALQIANFCEWLATDALDLDILASYSGDLDNNSQFETKLTVRRAGDNLVFALNSEVLGNASATMYGVDVAIDPAIAAVGDFVNATAQVAMMNEAGSQVTLFSLDGSGSKSSLELPSGGNYVALHTTNLNNQDTDGAIRRDLVATTSSGDNVVLWGSSSGLVVDSSAKMTWLNFDIDGIPDTVVVTKTSIYNGSSRFPLPARIAMPGGFGTPVKVVAGHFRSVSAFLDDFVVIGTTGLFLCRAAGDGSIGGGACSTLESGSVNGIADAVVEDVNGDGVEDLRLKYASGSSDKIYYGGTSGLSTAAIGVYTGDITKDGCVGVEDWTIFAENYGYKVGAGGNSVADFNEDGWIDQGDYVIIAQNWGKGCS